jgi:hypothetical protein
VRIPLKRSALAAALLGCVLLLGRAANAAVVVNGAKLAPDAVVQVAGSTYVALRPVGEALGADVRYDAKGGQVTVTTVLRQIVFHIGDEHIVVNGAAKTIEAPARQIDGRVMLPLRGLSDALGATLTMDPRTHDIVLVMKDGGSVSGAPTPPPMRSANTLEGTVLSVSAEADVPSVDIDVKGLSYTVTVPAHTKVQFRDTHGTVASDGALSQVKPGDTLIATLDPDGRVLGIADVFSGTSGTIASVAGQNMVLTNGRVIATDEHGTNVTLDGRTATMADLRAGNIVTVRSDPKTGKVREVVAFTPGYQPQTSVATAGPSSGPAAQTVGISSVTDNAAHPFHVGQSVNVAADGTAGGTASFDLSNVILDTPMREVRPGHYEGSYVVQIGTNLVDAPILVTLVKNGLTAHAVGTQPLNIITEPPQVKETAPASGARVNALRPSIYVTFSTLGGKGMNADSLQLVVDGKDVTAQSTRTGAFISYFPAADLHEGPITVQVKGTDIAGNALDYSWSFVIASR